MKKTALVLILIASSAATGFCRGNRGSGDGFAIPSFNKAAAAIEVPAVPTPSVSAAGNTGTGSAQLKEWTVMAFINGANDRADLYSENLRALGAVGTTDSVNVVAEFGLKLETRSLVQRMLVQPGDGKEISGQVYRTWINRDMGDWRNAADFVKWAKENFPAKRYMLIIQNHGGGFIDETYTPKTSDKGISYDFIHNSYIRIPDLGRLLAETGGADIFVMNACTMQQAEVGYEVAPYVGVVVASEENDSSLYYQHRERMLYLNAHAQATAEEIAGAFVAMRRRLLTPGNSFYSEVLQSTITVSRSTKNTLSAVRGGALAELPAVLGAWTSAVMAAGEADAIKFAVASTVRFGVSGAAGQPYSQFTDLGDFVGRVWYASKDQTVRDASAGLLNFLDKKLVIANSGMNQNASGVDYTKAVKGLAIKMIPLTPVSQSVLNPNMTVTTDTRYEDLRLSRDGSWDEFVKWAGAIFYQPR